MLYAEAELDWGLRLRGYIDRLDMTPAGDIRIVDYKTGKVPLMCLPDGEVLRYSPGGAGLRATQRKAGRCGRRSRGRAPRATGGPGRAGCATGAGTRRCARSPGGVRRRGCLRVV
jgi:hypothetical protein